jgi:hypothetical protein
MINYSSKYDYILNNNLLRSYISNIASDGTVSIADCQANCEVCSSSTACQKCTSGYKIFNGQCVLPTGYYLKFPITTLTQPLSIDTTSFNMDTSGKYTITIWIRFFGVLSSNNDDCTLIFNIISNGRRLICYNRNNRYLSFYDGSLEVFRDDTVFVSNIGQWTFIAFTSLVNKISNSSTRTYFNYFYNFYVQNSEIQRLTNPGSVYPLDLSFNTFEIGHQISALVSDLRIYDDYILNPHGHVIGPKRKNNMVVYISFYYTTTATDSICLKNSDVLSTKYDITLTGSDTYQSKFGASCIADYNPIFRSDGCPTKYYYDMSKLLTDNPPCFNCNTKCEYNCNKETAESCSCSYASNKYYYRYSRKSSK